jgi:hypothetical protein
MPLSVLRILQMFNVVIKFIFINEMKCVNDFKKKKIDMNGYCWKYNELGYMVNV